MIDFWLAIGLLLLVALGFLLIPAIRRQHVASGKDRAAVNVELYEERLTELSQQHAAGLLTAEQWEEARSEAARELLSDTQQADTDATSAKGGRAAPLIVALIVPLVGLGLYLHWGASERVELTREFSQPPRSMDEMTSRLERAVAVQPESSEGWYLLGRTYMSQERFSEAAHAFTQAVQQAGRQPELLGQLAQAQYFADGKVLTPEVKTLADEALKANPKEMTTLGLLGIAAFEQKDYAGAITHWQTLVDQLPTGDPSRKAIQSGIERARRYMGASGEAVSSVSATQSVTLSVTVSLDPGVSSRVKASDTVFVFARAVSGPPMPLAVKRLTVADLPARVSLSDADAMMPQLKLSGFDQVQLVARISRQGNPTSGEWVALGKPIAVKDAQPQQLKITQPDAN
ncbi:c-type cytochrome biogenesis protein CcmI [Pseudomonas sp. LTJR-52]|uniref:c-type cytochrome biogenesis protein CcmI n=1 Tax=Pseudomonas sp. LTJR-52 TaxID=2479392 RepID=UPI000EFB2D1B|nr:c-type cytochrome biogenesis protein CcmI [Pseudomonas sp. LTJR-52]AYN94913.1 c-type cytochrome biogenesis protein CcmI [Pseudomonas sp. LTJR-52]